MAQPVVTPEAVPLDFELASVGSRFFALLIDWTLQSVVLTATLFAATVASSAGGLERTGLVAAGAFLLVFVVLFGYPIAFETLWRGRTPGKAAMGLRVATREGAPVRFRHASIRAALGLVDFLLTGGAAAVLSTLLSRHSQRLGDIVAGTVVVRERTGTRATGPVWFAVPAGLESYAATLDLAGLRPSDYAAVRSFLVRAHTLPPEVRARLAAQLATPVAVRLHTTSPPGLHPETFLAAVAAAYQGRHAPPAGKAAASAGSGHDGPAPPPAGEPGGGPGGGDRSAGTGGFVPPA